jgi:hypothetical protein
MTALAKPAVFLPGRPAAQWATDTRGFRSGGLLVLFKLAIWNDDRILRSGNHAPAIVTSFVLLCDHHPSLTILKTSHYSTSETIANDMVVNQILQTPTPTLVQAYVRQFEREPDCVASDDAITLLAWIPMLVN